jgi:hypothetical protein
VDIRESSFEAGSRRTRTKIERVFGSPGRRVRLKIDCELL